MSAPSTCLLHQGCSHLWSTLPVLDVFPKCFPHPCKYFPSLLLSLNTPTISCQDLDWCMVYILTLSSPDLSLMNIRHLYPTASSPSLLYPKLNSVFYFQTCSTCSLHHPIDDNSNFSITQTKHLESSSTPLFSYSFSFNTLGNFVGSSKYVYNLINSPYSSYLLQ